LLAEVVSFGETSIRGGISGMHFRERQTRWTSSPFEAIEVSQFVIMALSGSDPGS
jgi:hypothetical protein